MVDGELPLWGGAQAVRVPGLRVKDIDFTYNQLVIRDSKGDADRVTMLPSS